MLCVKGLQIKILILLSTSILFNSSYEFNNNTFFDLNTTEITFFEFETTNETYSTTQNFQFSTESSSEVTFITSPNEENTTNFTEIPNETTFPNTDTDTTEIFDPTTEETFSQITTQENIDITTEQIQTTYEPIPPICYLNITGISSTDTSVTLTYNSDLAEHLSCFLNGTDLIIQKNLNESFIDNEIICSDLEPIHEYNLVFLVDCDVFSDYLVVETKYEILNCSDESNTNDSNDISFVCQALECFDCFVVFELFDVENNRYELTEVSAKDPIIFEHKFTPLNCSWYELKAYIVRQGFNQSESLILKENIYIFPKDIDFSVKIDFELNNLMITMKNNWINCKSTTAYKKISIPINCSSSELGSVYEKNSTVLNSLNLNDIISNISILYSTNYTIEVKIEKSYMNYSDRVEKTITFETDGFLVEIFVPNSTTDSIEFKYSEPRNCSYFEIYCEGYFNKTAVLDTQKRTGYCDNLISNQEYQIVALTRNQSGFLKDVERIFTKVLPVELILFEQKNDLNFSYQFDCKGNFDSYEILYSLHNQSYFKSKVKVVENCTSFFKNVAFQYQQEMLFGTKYDFKIRSYGCQGKCENDSNIIEKSIRLDDFNISSRYFTSTNNSLSLELPSSFLPRLNYTEISILCTYRTYRKKNLCNYDDIMCTCNNLNNSNTLYEIFLLNEKDGFTPVQNRVGQFYTKPNPVIFNNIAFVGLQARISFNTKETEVQHQICFKPSNKLEICSEIQKNDTGFFFDGTGKEGFYFGEKYDFLIKTLGCGNYSCPVESESKNIQIGLDKVKLLSTHPISSYQTNINLTFPINLLPNPNFDSISIKCNYSRGERIRECTNNTDYFTCNCNLLNESSPYMVTILTNKRELDSQGFTFPSRIVTKPPPLICGKNNSNENFLTVDCSIIQAKKEYLKKINLILRENKQITIKQITCSMDEDFTCTRIDKDGLFKFEYTFQDLKPATEYQIECQSFSNINEIYTSTFFDLKTDLDFPIFQDLTRVNRRLKLEFEKPKSQDYTIRFELKEKRNKNFVFYDEFLYSPKTPRKLNNTIDSIIFNEAISSKFKTTYKVEGEINKNGYQRRIINFDFEYTVPFPDFAIALIVIGGVFLIISPIFTVYYYRYRKQRKSQRKTLYKPSELRKILQDWDQHQNADLLNEWERLANESSEIAANEKFELCGNEARNIDKNRYGDILPYKHSRVRLQTFDDDDYDGSEYQSTNQSSQSNYFNDDYINASYIPGLKSNIQYIACQAPIKKTIGDFWKMVWERYIGVIIMLANVYEDQRGQMRKKCDVYWPNVINEKKEYGPVSIRLVSKIEEDEYIIRKIVVEVDKIKQKVRHYHFKLWPDQNRPAKQDLYNFMKIVDQQYEESDNKGPVIVHCSAGIGRTGTYLAIEYLAEQLRAKKKIDIYQRVLEMRKYRPKMVQNPIQYRFIYEMLEFIYQRETYPDRTDNDYTPKLSGRQIKYTKKSKRKNDDDDDNLDAIEMNYRD
ncbi:unnamed protein product [Brachionus calyciflorus]|uniref:protein-tyrosine-phosphatase n=1 Tax=Brachionus calyciflorus TaxID=104777 RepID=A0A814CJ97_9BILA|nr:unnamed protein product [Brachionus calyciflorus]